MTTKQQVQKVLEQLPEDCTVEDIQYQLYVLERIRRRVEMANADGAQFIPQDEVEARMQ